MIETINRTERWLSIVGYEGIYEVSDAGRVRRIAQGSRTWPGRLLKPTADVRGYLRANLCRDGIRNMQKIHRLVLLAFTGPPPAGMEQVNHRDGIKGNNAHGNLEWCAALDNVHHSVVMGLHPIGDRSPWAKLSLALVVAIRQRHTAGNGTERSLAIEYGVARGTIHKILRRQIWKQGT